MFLDIKKKWTPHFCTLVKICYKMWGWGVNASYVMALEECTLQCIAQCRNLWPEQHFGTTSLQNNATNAVKKKSQILAYTGKILVYMHNRKFRSRIFFKLFITHKHDQYLNVNILVSTSRNLITLTSWKFMVLTFIPESKGVRESTV